MTRSRPARRGRFARYRDDRDESPGRRRLAHASRPRLTRHVGFLWLAVLVWSLVALVAGVAQYLFWIAG